MWEKFLENGKVNAFELAGQTIWDWFGSIPVELITVTVVGGLIVGILISKLKYFSIPLIFTSLLYFLT